MYYNVCERDLRSYAFGKGWPAYRNISIKQMTDNDISKGVINAREENADNSQGVMRNTGGGVDNGINRVMSGNANGSMDSSNMNNGMNEDTRPRYDSMNGLSDPYVSIKDPDASLRDSALMKQLYTALNAILSPVVDEVINEYEYVGSPIYDKDGVDRETIAQIVGRVLDRAEELIDEAQEIGLEMQEMNMWSRNNLLQSTVEALVLGEIFAVRRPKYRRAQGNYVYKNGKYAGVREQ